MYRENQWNNNTRFSPYFQSGLSNTLHLTTTDSITLLRPAPPILSKQISTKHNPTAQSYIYPPKKISNGLYNNRGKGGKQFAHTVVIIYNDRQRNKKKEKAIKEFLSM